MIADHADCPLVGFGPSLVTSRRGMSPGQLFHLLRENVHGSSGKVCPFCDDLKNITYTLYK